MIFSREESSHGGTQGGKEEDGEEIIAQRVIREKEQPSQGDWTQAGAEISWQKKQREEEISGEAGWRKKEIRPSTRARAQENRSETSAREKEIARQAVDATRTIQQTVAERCW